MLRDALCGAYSASKAALSTFLESLRVELGPVGIRVTTVHPGYVETPMVENSQAAKPFMIGVEDAVGRILEGISSGKAVVNFPLPTALAAGFARSLPRWLFDRLARRLIKPDKRSGPTCGPEAGGQ